MEPTVLYPVAWVSHTGSELTNPNPKPYPLEVIQWSKLQLQHRREAAVIRHITTSECTGVFLVCSSWLHFKSAPSQA